MLSAKYMVRPSARRRGRCRRRSRRRSTRLSRRGRSATARRAAPSRPGRRCIATGRRRDRSCRRCRRPRGSACVRVDPEAQGQRWRGRAGRCPRGGPAGIHRDPGRAQGNRGAPCRRAPYARARRLPDRSGGVPAPAGRGTRPVRSPAPRAGSRAGRRGSPRPGAGVAAIFDPPSRDCSQDAWVHLLVVNPFGEVP